MADDEAIIPNIKRNRPAATSREVTDKLIGWPSCAVRQTSQ
ncbi:hypothetical protein B4135_3845 [Caldibacillus debilis]|uniref:Uncharacterized protein n=1 Tax=Caldibacillus debilis TaxID=301148 RepID=A0A150L9G1_9BACI|nr:hypothetical protein B4135_3845 [Caldibacillus debilis]